METQKSRRIAFQTGSRELKGKAQDHASFQKQFTKLLICFFLYFQVMVLIASLDTTLNILKNQNELLRQRVGLLLYVSLAIPILFFIVIYFIRHVRLKELTRGFFQAVREGAAFYLIYFVLLYFIQTKILYGYGFDGGEIFPNLLDVEEMIVFSRSGWNYFLGFWLKYSVDGNTPLAMFFYPVAPFLAHIITNITLNRRAAKAKTLAYS